ncbi:MAG: trimethylamine methyltransferase family protein, partial [Pseudomonadota bacterium]
MPEVTDRADPSAPDPSAPDAARSRRRAGGRAANKRRGVPGLPDQRPWGQVQLTDPPVEPVSADQVAAIDDAAMRILEEIGIDFLHEGARRHLKAAGCDVDPDGPRVVFIARLRLKHSENDDAHVLQAEAIGALRSSSWAADP